MGCEREPDLFDDIRGMRVFITGASTGIGAGAVSGRNALAPSFSSHPRGQVATSPARSCISTAASGERNAANELL
jgi:hypothetical protein